jgi:hypothetical protein
MKELGVSLLIATLLCVPAVVAGATTKTIRDHRGVVGVCKDFDKRYPTVSLHFCAKQDQSDEIFYYISINVTSSLRENLGVDDGMLMIKQVYSKKVQPLRFEESAVAIVSEEPLVFLKGSVVEVPEVIIKHIRDNIPVDFYFSIVGTKYEFFLTPQERGDLRMVALFDSLTEK